MSDVSKLKINEEIFNIKDKNAREMFKFQTITKNINVPKNNYVQGVFGKINVPEGYKLITVFKYTAYSDRFLIDFSFGKKFNEEKAVVDLYYVIENKYTVDISNEITAIVVFIKKENFNIGG